jgi:glycosyltransferase involved in cell wall biosynthesis
MASADAPVVLLIGAPLPPPYGGIARYMQLCLPAMAWKGFRVRILQPDQGIEPQPLAGLPLDADVKTEVFSYPGLVQLAGWFLRRPTTALRLFAWYATALVRRPRFSTKQLAATACWIRSAEILLGEERPSIVHAFDWPWTQGAAAVILADRYGGKSMMSFFGDVLPHRDELTQFDSFSRPFYSISRAVLREADLVASMTEHCRRLVRHVDLLPEEVALVRVMGDMKPFHPEVDGSAVRARHAPDDGPLILFVGQVRPRKGPQILVEALPQVREQHPETRLVIVGPDHDYANELRAIAGNLGLADAVDIVGIVDDDALPEYYAAADLFVFPTLTTIECLGLTFVQAMFSGVPVIATRIAGAPEVIRDGHDGLLVEPGDPKGLAERTVAVLDRAPEEQAALGLQGRERALQLFDEDEVLGDLFRAYDQLLGQARE